MPRKQASGLWLRSVNDVFVSRDSSRAKIEPEDDGALIPALLAATEDPNGHAIVENAYGCSRLWC